MAPADFSPWHYLLPPLLTFWPSFSPIIRPLPSPRASSLRCSLLSARHLSSPAYSNPQPGSCPGSFLPLPNKSVRPLSPEASQIRQPPAATRVQADSPPASETAGTSDLIPPPPLLLPNVSLPACTLECLWHSSLSTQSETRASCEACAALRDLPARPASMASAPEPLSCLLPSATSAAVLICSQAHACAGLCTCSSLCLGHSPEMPSWLTASLHSSRCSSVGSSGRPSRPP